MSTSSQSNGSSASIYSSDEITNSSEMSFHITDRPRRFTVITLKEIRYTGGCPCHPKDPEKAAKQSEALRRMPSLDAIHSLYAPHARPELTRRSDSQDSTTSTTSTTRPGLSRFFRRPSSRPTAE